jgi:glutathione S-transferase
MNKLTHFTLCPMSRAIRLALAEHDIEFELIEERPWEWRPAFLALNPAGELPVLQLTNGAMVFGAYAICEYLGETLDEPHSLASAGVRAPSSSFSLFPGDSDERAEVRRLIDWFNRKFDREVSQDLMAERIVPRLAPSSNSVPRPDVLRAVRANMKYHLRYLGFLADQRRWLAGESMSFADLAAAAHVSVADYLAEIPWEQHEAAKAWYQRIKSRPSFRQLLADRLPGFPPPKHYADLDF